MPNMLRAGSYPDRFDRRIQVLSLQNHLAVLLMISCVIGASGRLGSKIVNALKARGDEVISIQEGINYLIFAQRYRGEPSYKLEMEGNLTKTWRALASATWGEGDKAAVIVGSVCSDDPAMHESLAYNLSKSALPQVARYYAKAGPMRVNVVSPGTMRGDDAKVTEDEVVSVVAFLCSERGSGVNGQEIRVTG